MRAFSWQVFALTGDVDAYLLYKDIHRSFDDREYEEEVLEDEEATEYGNYS